LLQWEQSPIAKIDLVYQALKFTLASEVDAFWEDTERFLSRGERNIDIDNLQGIAIYIVWALKQPSILIDCLITSEFLSKGTKLSTRTLFLNVLKNSIEFLLDIQVDQNPQEMLERVVSDDFNAQRSSQRNPMTKSETVRSNNDASPALALENQRITFGAIEEANDGTRGATTTTAIHEKIS